MTEKVSLQTRIYNLLQVNAHLFFIIQMTKFIHDEYNRQDNFTGG